MLSKLRFHARHNVVGYLALFFALTGVAYAAGPLKPGDPAGGDLTGSYPDPSIAANAVNSGKVSDDSLTGADISEATLSGVPPSGAAGGDLTGSYPNPQLAPQEPWHEVGATGEPGFLNAGNYGGKFSTVAFYRDRAGVVHLKGVINGGNGFGNSPFVFRLPTGYRPAQTGIFAVSAASGSRDPAFVEGRIDVNADGLVERFSGGDFYTSLDGISFRCAPQGQDGCP